MNFPIVLIFFSLLMCLITAQEFMDTDTTSAMWGACSRRDAKTLQNIIKTDPSAAFARSADGRGPLFWAYEFGHEEAIKILEDLGVKNDEEDLNGMTPVQIGLENEELNKRRFSDLPPPSFSDDNYDDEEDEDEEDEDGDEL